MKKIIIFMISIILVCGLAGCGKSGKDVNKKTYKVGESKVNIYSPKANDIVCEDEQYQLRQPDSMTASVEEIMDIFVGNIANKLMYHTYMFDEENNLTLEFVVENGELDKEYELLFKASLCKTLFQIASIGNIQINISHQDTEVVDSSLYNRDSFYFFGYDPELGLDARNVKIYHADESGEKLVVDWMVCNPKAYEAVEQCMLEQMESLNMLPSGTKVESITINSGICYVKLTKAFANKLGNTSSEAVVYSIVNSIVSLGEVEHVVIDVEGNSSNIYRGSVDISKPLSFNEDLVKKN